MNNVSSKMTLYDMLAMVIPGFLLLMLFPFCCGCIILSKGINDIYTGVLLVLASYIIGLIYHKTIEYLYNKIGLRNNEKHIQKQSKRFYENLKNDAGNLPDEMPIPTRNDYYTAYYTLMKENMLNSIPILEVQVVFIRNLLPLIVLYIIAICCCGFPYFNINPCGLAISLVVIAVILLLILIEIQNKIYYLVWEGNEYLKQNNHKS
jgi:membrane protein YdbS with pleckstrin-like domain